MALVYLVITLLLNAIAVTADRSHTLEDVYNLLSRIDQNLRKEDRMREVIQMIPIGERMKSIENKLEEILDRMDGDRLGRGISSDLRSDLEAIREKIEGMEESARELKTMMTGIGTEVDKLEQLERMTEKMEKDLELRLTKLMNALSSLHEMNKRLTNSLTSSGNNRIDDRSSLSAESTTFLIESLEDLERKVKEQLSILEAQLRKELDSLKVMTSNVLVQCEPPEEVEPREDKEDGAFSNQIDVLAKNLSRAQREIREDFHLGMQELEQKLDDLTLTSTRCQSNNEIPTTGAPEAKTKCVSDQFIRDARNCADLRKSGTTCDGVYFVFHPSGRAIKVYCDMTTDGGGWSVIMRRGDFDVDPVNFNLPWRVYKHGFGDMNKEFWLGNENIHLLTNGNETNQLRIELESFNAGSKHFTVDSFSIGHENDEYRMHIKHRYRSPFLGYDNRPFVTYDRISDQPGDCAGMYKGAWWYRRHCIYPEVTGERLNPQNRTSSPGMQSPLWKAAGILKGAEMKIRPRNFDL